MLEIIVVQIAAFVGLVALLRWMFHQHVTAALQRITLLQQANLKREMELSGRLTAVQHECEQKVQQAQEESAKIITAAKAQADQAREDLLRDARRESERIISEAHERREEIRQELMREVDHRAVQLASDAIRYVLTTKVEEGIHGQLVDDLLTEIDGLEHGRLEITAGHAEVVASRPLTAPQRQRLAQILAKKAGRPIDLHESVDAKVIAGMVVKLDNLILDGSLKSKLQDAVNYVRKGQQQ